MRGFLSGAPECAPYRSLPLERGKFPAWLGLLAPVVFYFASIAPLFYSWSLDFNPVGLPVAIERVYIALYVVFALLLILPSAHLLREWQQYKESMASDFA